MGSHIYDFAPLRKGGLVFKYGRTSGLSVGVCNGVEAYVKLAGWRTPYNEQGKPGTRQYYKYTKEHIICMAPPRREDGRSIFIHCKEFKYAPSFAGPGDSGALVFDINGRAVGLLHGALGAAVGGSWHPLFGGQSPYDDEDSNATTSYKAAFQAQAEHIEKDGTEIFNTLAGAGGLVTPIQDIISHLRACYDFKLELCGSHSTRPEDPRFDYAEVVQRSNETLRSRLSMRARVLRGICNDLESIH